ncbi:MAG: spermine synthase [Microbacteriaceae bacterium]|nr:spermine synthase [Microbacteriaceae bacterium]
MTERASAILKLSGYRAVIEPDRWVPGSFTLIVDGTPQSHVNLDDPSQLFFEYVQRIGHVIDQFGMPGEPITAVHLGAGALTLPRYIEATRPGSRQQVIEIEGDLVDLVRSHLPLPRHASIRIRHGDAREVLAKLPGGLRGEVDLLVVDVFSGARTPAHVTSLEFYREAVALLKPAGIVVANVADGPGLAFARGQAATMLAATGHVAALAETQILKGRRFGNVVMVGSREKLPLDWMPRLLAGGPHPSKVVADAELRNWIAGAPIVTDATAVQSPPPSKNIFQVGTRGD